MLLAGFFVGWLIILLEIFGSDRRNVAQKEEGMSKFTRGSFLVLIEVIVNEICLAVLLVRFEEIDVIQQLEREVEELKKAEKNVQQQREKMHEFWSNAQQLTELWLYRTVPRLDLYKEVHSHLEDAAPEELLLWMAKANEQLENIDRNLGELMNWRNEGALSIEAKKNFGKTINLCCQEAEFEQIACRLEDISKSGMKCLEAPAPSPSPASGNAGMAGNAGLAMSNMASNMFSKMPGK